MKRDGKSGRGKEEDMVKKRGKEVEEEGEDLHSLFCLGEDDRGEGG